MARRKFQLPGIHELSKEQEDVRALPTDGQHLVIGGPGTGKSVLALLRSRRLHEEKVRYVFLVYNKLLHQASRQLFGGQLSSHQWQSWFIGLYRKVTGALPPRLPAHGGGFWQPFDWQAIADAVAETEVMNSADLPYLVIDEGQDMPPSFYQVLANLGFENFFVVADQNQQISPDENSTRKELEDALGIETREVIELTKNYRNTLPIARLAQAFYTGDPATPPPDLPQPSIVEAKKPLLYQYPPERFKDVIRRMLKLADRHPAQLIGIIAPNNEVRTRYAAALNNTPVQLDNGPPPVTTFASGDQHTMRFDRGGIMVINAQACKGLEFDVVFIVDINQFHLNKTDVNVTKRLFYVMVARATEQVIMLQEAGSRCAVEAILPQDPNILERKG
ncbi:hypothetical protein CKO15_08805 [Halorhodospira abdelmalekii]|uniref:ATP-binding domain-containing protein n=1 Tax=Halorhodospira abdelmalekii TaxID=421629 RepID=UPI001903CE55|nr:ATP-binding domain-containing protein [Halorhodospira abdelmalekii]MBK1735380.1 hypothetical protein [Halorhodospira abdelmalekii]